jgi:hypothetical protein
MSKHRLLHNVHFAASSRSNHCGRLALTALLLGSLAVPASAQNRPVARVAPEKHFTIPPDVPSPVVLQTEPDAACDLHPAGVNDPAQTMRLYGNIEGYVQFHFTPKQDIQDAQLQLDCAAAGVVTTHTLHLRIAEFPTPDMPAPDRVVPAPRGSKIRPALTDDAARQLSDEDIIAQGYPPRPNASESPEAYAKWLVRVSRPMTILPPHSVSRSGISHFPRNATAGPQFSNNWSGFEAQGPSGSYSAVYGSWRVPSVSADPSAPGQLNRSVVWVGLDGDGDFPHDLVQAGTEQNVTQTTYGTYTDNYAWVELFPNETIQEVFGVYPGNMISVVVYVGDSKGNVDVSGDYAWFDIVDTDAGREYKASAKLGTTKFYGGTAEWIVERLCQTNCLSKTLPPIYYEFAQYSTFEMADANVWTGGKYTPYSKVQNVKYTMHGHYLPPWYDDNVLSTVSSVASYDDWMQFFWKNFH